MTATPTMITEATGWKPASAKGGRLSLWELVPCFAGIDNAYDLFTDKDRKLRASQLRRLRSGMVVAPGQATAGAIS